MVLISAPYSRKRGVPIASYQKIRELVIGKLIDKTIDIDYEDLSEILFGEGNCFSSSEVRKRMYGMKTVIDALEQDQIAGMTEPALIDELEEKRQELQKERQKLSAHRTEYSKLLRHRARQEEINEILAEAILSGSLPELTYRPPNAEPADNDLMVSLNDIHYGAQVDNYWNTYNSEICARMLERYLTEIVRIGELHGSENCIVWANGDQISGNIHHSITVTNRENVIEQITGVSELIARFLAELSPHFKTVRFVSVAGNHSRIDTKERALISERLDDLIEWYLSARLQNHDNISIGGGRIDHTMYLVNLRGLNYLGVHGDYDGSPSKVQALQSMAQQPVYAVLSGHLHHNRIDTVQGIKTVMAGSFLGMDDYCISKRIVGRPEQLVCVCDENGIRCSYDIPLGG